MNTRDIVRPRTGAVFARGLQEHGRLTATTLLGALSSRRSFLRHMGLAGLGLAVAPAWAATTVKLPPPGGPQDRPITEEFPQKAAMILQRSRPPLLETPFEVFDKGVFTPNDQFFVRWHWAGIPTEIDVDKFRLTVRGHVNQVLSLSLQDILSLPRVEWPPSINAREIRGGCSRRASPEGNGATARWATPAGPASGSRTCWIARA